MRFPVGCELCRERHVKCVVKEDATRCERCKERNETCNRKSAVRFRAVTSISRRTKCGRTEKQRIVYNNDQTWTKLTGPGGEVNFLDKHEEGEEGPSPDPLQEKPSTATEVEKNASNHNEVTIAEAEHGPDQLQNLDCDIQDLSGDVLQLPNTHETNGGSYHNATTPLDPTNDLQRILSSDPQTDTCSILLGVSPGFNFLVPSPNNHTLSWPDIDILPPLYRAESGLPLRTRREAQLLCHFIGVLTPEMDIADPLRHFAREAPNRALYCPALMNAILALSARHISLVSGRTDHESDRYHADCLSSLIPALNDISDILDENLFVTVVVLTLYEERAQIDEQCHRLGQTRLLNTTSAFAAGGGMAEAASWLSLRQEIHKSFTLETRSNVRLENYLLSKAFVKDDEGSWTNRMVYVTAKVLSCVFQGDREVTPAEWDDLDSAVEAWNTNKPASFNPIWTFPTPDLSTSDGADADAHAHAHGPPFPPLHEPPEAPPHPTSAFPEIIMVQGAHAVAAQYYNTAKMLLATHNPHLPRVGFDAVRRRRDADRLAVTHLRRIVGLAVSNRTCENAMFMASHALHTCGFWLAGRREREEAVALLEGMQRRMGWITSHIVENLRGHWGGRADG